MEHKGKGDTDYIGRALDEIITFCEVNNVHCFLVAHPTKMTRNDDGSFKVPDLYSIAGSANFYNKSDNGICVYRDFERKTTTVYRQKVKFDHWGEEAASEYTYNVESKRYQSGMYPDTTNWITKDEEIKAIENSIPLPKLQAVDSFYEPNENDLSLDRSDGVAPF